MLTGTAATTKFTGRDQALFLYSLVSTAGLGPSLVVAQDQRLPCWVSVFFTAVSLVSKPVHIFLMSVCFKRNCPL